MNNASLLSKSPKTIPSETISQGVGERISLKAELEKQAAQVVEIPLIIGGREIWTNERIKVTMPHDHHHVIAECCMAGEKELKIAIDAASGER